MKKIIDKLNVIQFPPLPRRSIAVLLAANLNANCLLDPALQHVFPMNEIPKKRKKNFNNYPKLIMEQLHGIKCFHFGVPLLGFYSRQEQSYLSEILAIHLYFLEKWIL